MVTDFNPFKDVPCWLEGDSNVPVPVVDPADLKIVWELQDKSQKKHQVRTLVLVCTFARTFAVPARMFSQFGTGQPNSPGWDFSVLPLARIFPG